MKPYGDNLFSSTSIAAKGADGCVFSTGWGGIGEISLKVKSIGNESAFGRWISNHNGREELYNWLFPNHSNFFSGEIYPNENNRINDTGSTPAGRECGYPILFIYYS